MIGGKQAVAEVVSVATAAPDPRAAAEGDQVELFAPEIDAPISIDGKRVSPEELAERIARRGRGRPKGAQNRVTREWREWWLARGVDPIGDALKYLAMTPVELAAYLKCDVDEAFDRQQRIREFVAPYLHARQAPTDDQGNAVPIFNVQVGGGPIRDASGRELPPWEAYLGGAGAVIEGELSNVENQQVSAGDPPEPKSGEPK